MKLRTLVSTFVLFVAMIFVGASPAQASTGLTVEEKVEAALEQIPGAVQTAWNEVSWDDGDVVLTFVSDAEIDAGLAVVAAAVGSCASGKVCAYSAANYAGDKLTFSTCTSSMSLSSLGTAKSVANARSSGSVKAYSGSTLLATITHGTGKNVAAATKLSCS